MSYEFAFGDRKPHESLRFSNLFGFEHLAKQVQSIRNLDWAKGAVVTGTNGTGKSTLARILVLLHFCKNPVGADPCLECDACQSIMTGENMYDLSWYRGESLTNDGIKEMERWISFMPYYLETKCVVIDDLDLAPVDLITKAIGLLEEYRTVPFVFTVTDRSKLKWPLLQRCQIFSLDKLTGSAFAALVTKVCAEEGVAIEEPSAIHKLEQMCCGIPRITITAIRMLKTEGVALSIPSLRLASVRANTCLLTQSTFTSGTDVIDEI